MVFAVIGVFIVLAVLHLPKLIKGKKYKELLVVSLLLAIGFTLNLLLAFGVNLTNPLKSIEAFFDMIHLHY